MNVLLSANNYNEDWIYMHLKKHIRSHYTVAVIPFSFNSAHINDEMTWDAAYNPKDGHYYMETVGPLQTYGIDLDRVTFLNYFKDDPDLMYDIISQSDILFFTGGLPDQAMIRIRELGLEECIYTHKGLKIGVSAGALIQMPQYAVTPDADYPETMLFEGLSLIHRPSWFIEVHHDKENVVQQEALQTLLKNDAIELICGIGERGAIFVDGEEWQLVGDVCILD